MTVRQGIALPIPPLEMRILVGPTDEAAFDNPTGDPVFPHLPERAYDSVFDFGCGCGRVARQLIQQRARPRRYLGIDLHAGMVAWCNANLASRAEGFQFVHHDVFNIALNPGNKPAVAPFPVPPGERFTLVNAWSVFTHILEEHIPFYLSECARVLEPGGIFQSTWFVFDKTDFPMMQEMQNALYINHVDPTNAVIVDVRWLNRVTAEAGLTITSIAPPKVRGFQWTLQMQRTSDGVPAAVWPADEAPTGIVRAQFPPQDPHRIGQPPQAH